MKKIVLAILLVSSLFSNELMIEMDSKSNESLNILFKSGSYQVDSTQQEKLDKYVDFLFDNHHLSVDLLGHTDSIGSKESNMKISIKRVETVKEYFINEGILESRINTISCGETTPKFNNKTAENRQMNRRVEAKTFVTFE